MYAKLVLVAALIASSGTAHAQSTATDSASTRGITNENSGWERDHCLAGLTYGAPMKLALSVAEGIRRDLASGQHLCIFVAPKIGLGGARLGVGAMRTIGSWGGGIGASAGVIRTFGAPSWADRQSTYAGASLHILPELVLGFELGWYHRIDGKAGQGRENIFAWSFGIGI